MLEGVLAMTTNQPTDVAQFKESLYKKFIPPIANWVWKHFESLTAQLAAKQAEAKAWESWGLSQHNALQDALYLITLSQTAWDYEADELLQNTEEDCNVPKPQPVDAPPLARIARVALEAGVLETLKFDAFTGADGHQVCCKECTDNAIEINDALGSVKALTPNDIALAQALAGGA